MLDLIGYTSDKDLSSYRLLEPSFGQGDFLIEIQRRIIKSAEKFHFDASSVMSHNIGGCEIDDRKYERCVETLRIAMPDFKPYGLKNQDFLLSEWNTKFDYIIGNPPYIRYENIPKKTRDFYKAKYDTFHYRCDLYVLFYEHCLDNLAENGRHCFICSNRWLKNEYGKKLRVLISTMFKLEYIIDVEGLDVFQESVLAYPSITLIENAEPNCEVGIATIRNLDDLRLPLSSTIHKINRFDSWNNLFVDEDTEDFDSIESQGFDVGIGVATGADKIFISDNLPEMVESELLLPIINAKDLTGNEFSPRGLFVLNPYGKDGKAIDLNRYPRAKQYLEGFKSILEKRHIVKNGRVWYSLIDRIKPHLAEQPKILLPDISGNKVIFVDSGHFYPAHNIYYITGKSIDELILLAAILMSGFVRGQIESISNKMNGGLPRWQSQSIKRIKIPMIAAISPKLRNKLAEAYHNRDIPEIDMIVRDIVRQQSINKPSSSRPVIPKSLFDYDFSGETNLSDTGIC